MRMIREIPDGSRGFDCNQALTADTARAALAHGYGFAIRYIRRTAAHALDLSFPEVEAIVGAGLGLLLVQHVESEVSWEPFAEKGTANGKVAVSEALRFGPAGMTVACDLEGVAPGTDPEAVIQYCNRWRDQVAAAGFLPCLYVGWHCGLTAEQLYRRLRFTRYWGALNLNTDEFPTVRGLCMKQHEERADGTDRPDGVRFPIDTDTTMLDHLGGRLTMLVEE